MEPIVLNKITIYPDRRRVEVNGKRVDGIGYPGWYLLYALAQTPGQLISRDMLFANVYPDPEARPSLGNRAVDYIASRVRKVLALNADGHDFIQPVRHHGYALVAPD